MSVTSCLEVHSKPQAPTQDGGGHRGLVVVRWIQSQGIEESILLW